MPDACSNRYGEHVVFESSEAVLRLVFPLKQFESGIRYVDPPSKCCLVAIWRLEIRTFSLSMKSNGAQYSKGGWWSGLRYAPGSIKLSATFEGSNTSSDRIPCSCGI